MRDLLLVEGSTAVAVASRSAERARPSPPATTSPAPTTPTAPSSTTRTSTSSTSRRRTPSTAPWRSPPPGREGRAGREDVHGDAGGYPGDRHAARTPGVRDGGDVDALPARGRAAARADRRRRIGEVRRCRSTSGSATRSTRTTGSRPGARRRCAVRPGRLPGLVRADGAGHPTAVAAPARWRRRGRRRGSVLLGFAGGAHRDDDTSLRCPTPGQARVFGTDGWIDVLPRVPPPDTIVLHRARPRPAGDRAARHRRRLLPRARRGHRLRAPAGAESTVMPLEDTSRCRT